MKIRTERQWNGPSPLNSRTGRQWSGHFPPSNPTVRRWNGHFQLSPKNQIDVQWNGRLTQQWQKPITRLLGTVRQIAYPADEKQRNGHFLRWTTIVKLRTGHSLRWMTNVKLKNGHLIWAVRKSHSTADPTEQILHRRPLTPTSVLACDTHKPLRWRL